MVKGRGAKAKGSKAERQVRNELRKLYPPEKRSRVQRVPMSGASWMKGDVIDMNNTDWSYEVKKQETLALPEWWRQTKVQAQSFQIPCLIFTSNFRPFYWVLERHHWDSTIEGTPYVDMFNYVETNTRKIYDKLSSADKYTLLQVVLDDDDVVIVPNNEFLDVRRSLLDE